MEIAGVGRKTRRRAPPRIDLGLRLRELRTQRKWTLADAAKASSVARSTLSKIENGLMSPTFEVIQKIVRGFGIDYAALFAGPRPQALAGRRSITRKGTGQTYRTGTHRHQLLNADLADKRMLPFCSRVTARSLDQIEGWMHHEGEEFAYVLSGDVRVFSEHFEPVDLKAGDSIYLDGRMGHAFVSTGAVDSVVLWVVTA